MKQKNHNDGKKLEINFAIKIIPKMIVKNYFDQHDIMNERDISILIKRNYKELKINHNNLDKNNFSQYPPFFTTVISTLQTKKAFIFVTDFVVECLENHLLEFDDNLDVVVYIVASVGMGLDFLWSNRVIHRDIKVICKKKTRQARFLRKFFKQIYDNSYQAFVKGKLNIKQVE